MLPVPDDNDNGYYWPDRRKIDRTPILNCLYGDYDYII